MQNIDMSKVRKGHVPTAKLITDSIDFDILGEYYNVPPTVAFGQLCAMIQNIAKKEVSHYFKTTSTSEATGISEWLRGLPSVCSIPFSHYDIEQWLRANNILDDSSNERKVEKALDEYWYKVGLIINQYAVKNTKQLKENTHA